LASNLLAKWRHSFKAAKISDFATDEKLYRACEMEIVGPPLSLG